jgi:predicted amidohydrolase YtcJ
VLDLDGATVVPGLVDAHAHLLNLGASLERVGLVGTRSAAEVAERVRARAQSVPHDSWILGRGWDQNDWTGAERTFPERHVLDAAAPNHPVLLTRIDGHAVWANSRALALAGLSATTPDPEGGEIVRGADGAPLGVLVDRATDLVEAAVPPPSSADLRRRLLAAMAAANAAGLTGVHDTGIDAPAIEAYRALARDGKLTLRVYAMVSADAAGIDSILAAGPLAEGLFTLRCVKIVADGAMGSRGALMLEDYADRPGHRGLAVTPKDRIATLTSQALIAGFQVATHAIGDAAIRHTIDAYSGAMAVATLPASQADLRLRIEHLQRIHPDDLPRLAPLGIIASMQPTHATSDMPWVGERLGNERLHGAYAWRSVLATGAVLALGSDFPVESHRPLLGLYAAITRQDSAGQPPGGWLGDEKLTPREALAGFTHGAAVAAFAERENGSLAPGFRADLTVLALDPVFDPLTADPRALLSDDAVVATVVDGKLAYRRR